MNQVTRKPEQRDVNSNEWTSRQGLCNGNNGLFPDTRRSVLLNSLQDSEPPGLENGVLTSMALLQAPIAVVICDEALNITLANQLSRDMSTLSPDGRKMSSARAIWGEIVDEAGRPDDWPCSKGLPLQSSTGIERRIISKRHGHLLVQISSAPVKAPDGELLGAIVMFYDASLRQRAELLRRNDALANERARIAGNIHDNVAQGLNAAILRLRATRQELSNGRRLARTHLQEALKITRGCLDEARRVTSVLSDQVAVCMDPGAALRTAAEYIFSGMCVDLQFALQKPVPELPFIIRRELVLIGKEALTNSFKHANPSTVKVQLRYTKHHAELSVADNGSGFAYRPGGLGFGQIGMRLRSERVGGKFQVDSVLGRGTCVVASLPLAPIWRGVE
jgi:signal transduction histidine kinase